ISLNPGDVMAHHWYSLVLRTAGRHEAAMAEIRIARELDPLSPVISTSLARHYYFDGDYERARAEARNALALDSTYFQAHLAAGLIAVQRGEYEAAMESYRTAERVLGMEAPVIAALTAHALGAAGRPGQARRLYEGLRSLPDSVYVPPQFLAIAAIGAGRHDEAVDWLEAALEERSAAFLYMEIEPAVEPLRDHPGFRRLLARAEALDPPPAHSTSRPAAGR
ncbi:MAG: tetratricopeptide repeat protein, partial [Gemmatimonadetes bacterium]|nr:tetratricopeptide repeat protein [Gemmatimonadota bacterium]NIQ52639.1 tetratricopeptide repeat protein [Gemmatimonadota bacterium]NIU72774.1 tetratricopeptide repeat protein [Gammaproteobacteria bacterium]NIX43169.1 tetratricopeptide repeat protein [Gemmatimonadota bacterium]